MASKKSYSRFFIILQEDEKGHGLTSDKAPSGYTKIEVKNNKCKLSYYVQNLKKNDKNYYMALICDKDDVKNIINVSKLNIDDNGKADTACEYDVNNIGNTGVSLDKISGSAIISLSSNRMKSIMSGFITNEISKDWKNFRVISEETLSREQNVETKFDQYEKEIEEKKSDLQRQTNIEKVEEKNIGVQPDFKVGEGKGKENSLQNEKIMKDKKEILRNEPQIQKECDLEIKEDRNITNLEQVNDDEFEMLKESEIQRHKKKHEHDNECKEEHKEEKKSKKKEKEECQECKEHEHDKKSKEEKPNKKESHNEGKKNLHEEYHNMENIFNLNEKMVNESQGIMNKFFKDIVKDFEKVLGYDEIKNCTWYKVNIYQLEDMYCINDYKKYTVVYYPLICYYPYISKYKHCMVGHKHDKNGDLKYLIYAIPGKKAEHEQPYGGKTGFVTWMPSKNTDDYGYWIMFYDFKNSTVVVPVKK
ncbi:hypothetical protein [Clostridium senegalense]|uniref:DUF7922 domain-containing protein n=1 Tax=Clostridium senegalense TaxID=1465809 RepID=A0A6M0H0C0_9CLOT|nr:hypothetical protein [Clostridium senegalense]NEU04029.1 hypothetical protein [Clostridium senegalense]